MGSAHDGERRREDAAGDLVGGLSRFPPNGQNGRKGRSMRLTMPSAISQAGGSSSVACSSTVEAARPWWGVSW